MHLVCDRSQLSFLKILMAHEPNIEIDVEDNNGNTPLLIAVKNGKFNIVVQCLQESCNPF